MHKDDRHDLKSVQLKCIPEITSPSALVVYSRSRSSIRLAGTFRCSSSRSSGAGMGLIMHESKRYKLVGTSLKSAFWI